MPVEIFLSKANAQPEYETIDEEDVLDTDEVVEHITEEVKEGEEGEPKKKAKIVKTPCFFERYSSAVEQESERVHKGRIH